MEIARKIWIILLITCSFCIHGQVGYIIAGQHGSSDYYYKFNPDSIVINASETNSNSRIYNIDVNHDGTGDFEFSLVPPGNAHGGNRDNCKIRRLYNSEIAFEKFDTCFNNSGVYWSRYKMAHAFRYGDTVNSIVTWDTAVYLSYMEYYFGMSSSNGVSCGNSYSTDTSYLGVRILVNSIYEYGWIKIVGTFFNYYGSTLTMGTFACNNYAGIGIERFSNKKQVIVYPNPANNNLHISGNGISEIIISDVLGNEIKTQKINCTVELFQIDLTDYSEGIYFVKVKTSEGEVTKKVIVQH